MLTFALKKKDLKSMQHGVRKYIYYWYLTFNSTMVTEGTWHDLNSFQIYCFMAQVVAYLGKCFIHKIIMSREIMPSHVYNILGSASWSPSGSVVAWGWGWQEQEGGNVRWWVCSLSHLLVRAISQVHADVRRYQLYFTHAFYSISGMSHKAVFKKLTGTDDLGETFTIRL